MRRTNPFSWNLRAKVLILLIVAAGALGAGFFSVKPALVWRLLGDVNQPQARHESSYVEVNGNFYLLGGRGVRRITRYNPADSTWTEGSHTPNQISLHHFQAAAIGDTIFVLAAYTGTFPDELTVPNIYKYDTDSDHWVTGPVIPPARRRGSAGVAVYNGKLYVVGGSVGGHADTATRLKLFDEYDPHTNKWTSLQDAPRARDHVNVVVEGHKLYVVGGRNGGNNDNVRPVDVYDFNTGQWSSLPSPSGDIPTSRAGAATVVVAHHIVVIGGESTQDLAHREVEALNTLNNTWISLNPLVVGRHGTQAVFFNDNIYIAAGSGQKGGSPELSSHEVFETHGQTDLPVELSPEFRAVASGTTVALSWRTLSETNNAGFEVQHQEEGRFEAIGFVEGMGTSMTPQDYRFVTASLPPGRHVFRLKQIDFNGGFEYSPEVGAVIAVDGGFYLGAVYPNPLNPEARFTLTLSRGQRVRIEVFDVLGRSIAVVYDGELAPMEARTFELQSGAWAGGKYILRAIGDHFVASRTFTVLK